MLRRFILLGLGLFLCASSAFAALTTGQLATLKAAVIADPTANAYRLAGDTFSLQAWVNGASTTVVWKSSVTIRETGQAFNGAEWAGMTTANHTRLQTVAQYLMAYNPSIQGVRDMFNDIWSGAGGTVTRASLLALWKRFATRTEALFITGTGSDASPGTLVFEGAVSQAEVSQLLN